MSLWNVFRLTTPVVPGRERLVSFFGIRLRLVVGIVAAGVGGGVLGAVYLWTLDRSSDVFGPERWAAGPRVGVLVAGGLAVTLLIRLLGQPASVELVVDNIHLPEEDHEARIRSLLPISLVCIGLGGTLGPEAPLVTTTGTIASRAARRAGLSGADVRIMTITGMAAGFAVLFGAPLGAAMFALEIPHRRGIGYHEAVIPACIGAVFGYACSTAAGRAGLSPVWDVPLVDRLHWVDLGWSVVAGMVGAAIAAAFTFGALSLSHLVHRVPAWVRPVLGGAALGAIALATPMVLTNGEYQVQTLVATSTVGALVVALVAKLAGAAIAVATGWRGGFIIPLFFAGFCAGHALAPYLPGATHWAFVVAVMIAANVGVTKTPLGSTLVVLEMAGMAVLPTALIAALTSLIATAPVVMIDAQRERVDVYGPAHGP